jgi:hypothetical protein
MLVQIVVNCVNGKVLKLELQGQSPMLDLKRRIFEAWRIPPRAQKLVCGTDVLQDAEEIVYYARLMGEPLNVSMVVSLDNIQASLEGSSQIEIVEAIEALPLLPVVPPGEVIIGVGECLKLHSGQRMRTAVTCVLSRAISESDHIALQIALDFSRSHVVRLRIAGACALWPLVLKEENRQIATDVWMPVFTESREYRTRYDVLKALLQVAGTATDIARDILIRRYDCNPAPVAVALQCIASAQEDQSVIAQRKHVIMSHLQALVKDGPDGYRHGQGNRNIDVFTAMTKLPYSCDLDEIAVLAEGLDLFAEHANAMVGLLSGLPQVLIRSATNGGETGMAAQKVIQACLGHSKKTLRIEMLGALAAGVECPVSCEFATHSAIEALHDYDQDVALVAIHVLGECIKLGRQDARAAVRNILKHKEKPVRLAAKRALSLIG